MLVGWMFICQPCFVEDREAVHAFCELVRAGADRQWLDAYLYEWQFDERELAWGQKSRIRRNQRLKEIAARLHLVVDELGPAFNELIYFYRVHLALRPALKKSLRDVEIALLAAARDMNDRAGSASPALASLQRHIVKTTGRPRHRQVAKILTALHPVGKEVFELDLQTRWARLKKMKRRGLPAELRKFAWWRGLAEFVRYDLGRPEPWAYAPQRRKRRIKG
jgi:hypothetical protein